MTPKIFISYSWTPSDDKDWVLELAERLTKDGVFVIIDEWDLQEGQDIHQFIEKMVLDTSITSVLVIANSSYKLKADNKKGGVGKESLIISNEIYSKADQTKFIPIILEFDDNHRPCLPTFMNGRYYIDMSKKSFDSNYEKLLRRLFNKPERVRPPIGQEPVFLKDDSDVTIKEQSTYATFKTEQAIIKNGQTYNFFKGDISISLVSTSLSGDPLRYRVLANVWSPMFAAVSTKLQDIGYSMKYKAKDEFEIRIIGASTFDGKFQVTKVILPPTGGLQKAGGE